MLRRARRVEGPEVTRGLGPLKLTVRPQSLFQPTCVSLPRVGASRRGSDFLLLGRYMVQRIDAQGGGQEAQEEYTGVVRRVRNGKVSVRAGK